MQLKTIHKFALIFFGAFILSACATNVGYSTHHNYEGEYKNLSDVGFLIDVNHTTGKPPNPILEFRYAKKYEENGKKQSGGRLGIVGVSFLGKYVEALPGKYSFELGCRTRTGFAIINYDLVIDAGKTVKISCELVPESKSSVYIKLHSITNTDADFKRLLPTN
jgi:hypothetical protein